MEVLLYYDSKPDNKIFVVLMQVRFDSSVRTLVWGDVVNAQHNNRELPKLVIANAGSASG